MPGVIAKHPIMAGRESLVRAALKGPDEVRQSRTDPQVRLFHKVEATKRWTCAIAKHLAAKRFSATGPGFESRTGTIHHRFAFGAFRPGRRYARRPVFE